jgi:hypothetical protein
MAPNRYRNTLQIGHGGKGVPYGRATRSDGALNHGFKNLKGDLSQLDSIPELNDEPALRSLIGAINAPSSALFSIGCLADDVDETSGHRRTGYVEFAFNSKTHVVDAGSYFPAFFHFDRLLQSSAFPHAVQFNWELAPAAFLDARVEGFTCSVFINTHFSPSRASASEDWDAAASALNLLLSAIPCDHNDAIY